MANGQRGGGCGCLIGIAFAALLGLAAVLLLPLMLLQQADGTVFKHPPVIDGTPQDFGYNPQLVPGATGTCGTTPPRPVPTGMLLPVDAPVTSPFGVREDPFGRGGRCHTGIDLGASTGTPIHAAADGTVIATVPTQQSGGYGNLVRLDHGGGVETWYGHMSRVLVTAGQQVHKGDPIGLVGATGLATGPHLHWEVRVDGVPVNPALTLSDKVPPFKTAIQMIATAYSPGDGYTPGTITASGLPAGHGVVAVDPTVIPLGTKLYVDGYGPAVAGDTGSAILGYRIDLGMDTVAEAQAYGRQLVTVYVLQ